MSRPPIRRPIHRGSVLAAGLFVDVRGSEGEAAARARLLRVMGAGARLFRTEGLLIACIRVPLRLSTTAAPAGLLVRYGDLLSSAPLEKDEVAGLNTVGPAAVIVLGGAPVIVPLDAAHGEDPATWIDVADFEVTSGIEPLGQPEAAPRQAIAASEATVRSSLGVAAAPAEAIAIRRALSGRGSPAEGEAALAGAAGARSGLLGRVAAGLLAGLSAFLDRLSRVSGGAPARAGAGAGRSRGGARTGAGTALAAREDERPPGRSWLSALSRGLGTLALRLLVASRMAHVVGRRQAEYLSRMLDMFERGDLDAALRHAIPLGGDGGGEPAPPALGTPSPRSDLAIAPARLAAASALYSGLDLFEELRSRYRRAFEQLERAGDIERAAFVLAELLGADEEAVAFLEKHRRFRLAAEIAEARGLPAGLVVRQWFLAGDVRRAVLLSRARGAFADAVHRLEASGRKREAESLRLAWADSLAEAGSFAAAVSVVWPVEPARKLAGQWLDLAILAGGITGAQMALRKARLFPDSYPDIRDHVLGLLREEGEDGLSLTRALAVEIGSFPDDPSSRALARPVLRALLRAAVLAEEEENGRRVLAEGLMEASQDALLSAEIRMLWKSPAPAIRLVVTAAGETRSGRRFANEDTLLVASLSPPAEQRGGNSLRADVSKHGVVLGVFDGMGGYQAGEVASRLAATTITSQLHSAPAEAGDVSAARDALRGAVIAANAAIVAHAKADRSARGAGTTVAVATVTGTTLIVAHVGDSRVYLLRAGELGLLTRDHTLATEQLVVSPDIPVEDLPRNILTRALGMRDDVQVDVATAPLRDGDTVLLCTDGVWEAVPGDRLAAILASGDSPAALCARILAADEAGDPADDQTVVVARFAGGGRAAAHDGPVAPGDATWDVRRDPQAPLIHRTSADAGALAIQDAAELPDGRLLVALGELGAWIVSREGRVLTRFAEPAAEIVMSDHGDRALVLARRGETTRIARIDLVGRRRQPWCDARITAFARDFDGSVWYVASGDTLYAIDATTAGWEHLFQVSEPGARIAAVARDGSSLAALFSFSGDPRSEMWTWELPAHRLRARTPLVGAGAVREALVPASGRLAALMGAKGDGQRVRLHRGGDSVASVRPMSIDLRRSALNEEWLLQAGGDDEASSIELVRLDSAQVRLRVALDGGRAGGRIRGDRVVVFDDRGRLLVISLRTGAVIREVRLS